MSCILSVIFPLTEIVLTSRCWCSPTYFYNLVILITMVAFIFQQSTLQLLQLM